MAMEWGRAHVIAFSHVLNAFVLAIFCILWYNFQLNVANYAFFLFLLVASTFGHHSRLNPRCGQGEGVVDPMWTQWRNVDPGGRRDDWGCNEWKGSNVCKSGSETTQPKLGFPM